MKKTKQVVAQTEDKLVPIASAKELQAACEQPLYCDFGMDGKLFRIPCKRLTKGIEEQVRALKRVTPPWHELRKEYDYNNPQFLAKVETANAQAESLIVYWGCPLVSSEKPGLTNPDEIHKFVREMWTANILKAVELTITSGGMQEVVERANFT